MTEMKKEDMSTEVREQFKWFKVGCLIGEDENILERFEEIYFSAIKDEISLDERIEDETIGDGSNEYLDYILNEVKSWDNFEELYSHKTPRYETFYALLSENIMKTEKRCGKLKWEVEKRFDKTKLSFRVLHKSRKDDAIPDDAKKIEEER